MSADALTSLTALAPVAVVAPHPDDETLGCGGLLAHCADQEIPTMIVAMTDGEASHPGSRAWPPARLARARRAEQRRALELLGHGDTAVHHLGLPDGGLDGLSPAARWRTIARLRVLLAHCGTVFVTALDDDHADHSATARLVSAAMIDLPGRAFSYSIWPPAADLRPDHRRRWRLDIADVIQRKRRALAAFGTQNGGRVDDDPDGFRLPASLLARAHAPTEWFGALG